MVAEYAYDVWGKVTEVMGTAIEKLNPIRYRGYYWDAESSMYYLQSRYYSPELCRFISADVYADTGDGILGTNMYAYCHNDPVNLCDPSGLRSTYVTTEQLLLQIADLYLYEYVPAYKKLKDWQLRREISARTKFADDVMKKYGTGKRSIVASPYSGLPWDVFLENSNYTRDGLYIYAFSEGYDRNREFWQDMVSTGMMSGGIEIVGGPGAVPLSPKMMSQAQLKSAYGITDVHQFKEYELMTKKNLSKWNVFQDTTTKRLWLRNSNGAWFPTDIFPK